MNQGKEKFRHLLQTLQQDLRLSADQKDQLEAALRTFRDGRRSVREEFGDDKMARKEAMKTHRKALRQRIRGMLNDEQLRVWRENKASYRQLLKG